MVKAILDMLIASKSKKTIVSNQIIRNIISKKSEGNINLQKGKFITKKQHEANVNRVLKYKF